MLKISETIVVEGKGDVSNLSKVCEANFIISSGLHISKLTYNEIEIAIDRFGIIIFTDPDSAGRTIRRKISERFKDKEHRIKHAYISQDEGRKNGDLGVENADKEVLIKSLKAVLSNKVPKEKKYNYTMEDMIRFGLSGSSYSKEKRILLSSSLRIGYSNASSLLKKLNHYQIEESYIRKILNI